MKALKATPEVVNMDEPLDAGGRSFEELYDMVSSRPVELDEPIDSPARVAATATGANRRTLERIELLRDQVCHDLADLETVRPRPDEITQYTVFAEAYRTNWIEGSCIPVTDVCEHIRTGRCPYAHPETVAASLDIVHGYHLILTDRKSPRQWSCYEDFQHQLQDTHQRWFHHRPYCQPGQWKTQENHVAGRLFTPPAHVDATLWQAWQLAQTVPAGDPRANIIEYAIIEIHPFADGNGRISRFMGNHELSVQNEQRLITPEPFFDQYCAALEYLGLPESIVEAENLAHYVNPADWLAARHHARRANRQEDDWHRLPSKALIQEIGEE